MRKQPEQIDWPSFFNQFRQETDRACAVLGRALLEELLRRFLETRIIQEIDPKLLFEINAPFSSFSSRILLCHALGLFPENVIKDLQCIRGIGNDFAHHLDHTLSFTDQSIKARIDNLRHPLIMTKFGSFGSPPISESEILGFQSSPRKRFEIAVGILQYIIEKESSKNIKPSLPPSLVQQLESNGPLDL